MASCLPTYDEWRLASGVDAKEHQRTLLLSTAAYAVGAVGLFPEDAGPFGHHDLGGLVCSG